MTQPETAAPAKSGLPKFVKRAIWIVIAVVVLVVTYFILASFIPRWWAQRIGNLSDASFGRGLTWGLFFGGVCTFVPLLLLLFAVLSFSRREGRKAAAGRVAAAGFAILALIVSTPNLMTLTVVLGSGDGAHAGERIMDVDAPWFRGGSLIGAIVGALIFVAVAFYVVRYKQRGRKLRKAQALAKADQALDDAATSD